MRISESTPAYPLEPWAQESKSRIHALSFLAGAVSAALPPASNREACHGTWHLLAALVLCQHCISGTLQPRVGEGGQ